MFSLSDAFFQHIPAGWWPWLIVGLLGTFAAKQAIEASDAVAGLFGRIGRHMRVKAVQRNNPYLEILKGELDDIRKYMDKMEVNQEITQAYLVSDAQWHNHVDVLLAEQGSIKSLPVRLPFSEFSRRWRDEGWRPPLAA